MVHTALLAVLKAPETERKKPPLGRVGCSRQQARQSGMAVIMLGWERNAEKVMARKLTGAPLASQWPIF
ncbi:hypothetical protein C4K24_2940 [Pseudomonas chlororaphis subsp. aurantiaca]|nr:hypothetical protein C4K24_2940 [Pseudomonas chlororaphis subsp. aurantiaca]